MRLRNKLVFQRDETKRIDYILGKYTHPIYVNLITDVVCNTHLTLNTFYPTSDFIFINPTSEISIYPTSDIIFHFSAWEDTADEQKNCKRESFKQNLLQEGVLIEEALKDVSLFSMRIKRD